MLTWLTVAEAADWSGVEAGGRTWAICFVGDMGLSLLACVLRLGTDAAGDLPVLFATVVVGGRLFGVIRGLVPCVATLEDVGRGFGFVLCVGDWPARGTGAEPWVVNRGLPLRIPGNIFSKFRCFSAVKGATSLVWLTLLTWLGDRAALDFGIALSDVGRIGKRGASGIRMCFTTGVC